MSTPDWATPDNTTPGGDEWDDDWNLSWSTAKWNLVYCGFNMHDDNNCLFTVYPDWEAITGRMWISNQHDSGWKVFAAGSFPIPGAAETYEFRIKSERRNYSWYWQGQVFTDTYLDNTVCERIVFHWFIGSNTHVSGPCMDSSQWIGDNPDSI